MGPLRTKSVSVEFSNGKVNDYEVSVYKSQEPTYGNQYSLYVEDKTHGYTESYDVRYDTRLRRDLSNFDEYVGMFMLDAYSTAVRVL